MEEDDQNHKFSWSRTKNFSQGSCSSNSTPSSAGGGMSPDAAKAWNAYPSPGAVDRERLSDEMKAWNPYYSSPSGATYGEMLSDEMKAWNPYYNTASGPNQDYKDPPFVFTAGGGGSRKRVDDTPFAPERGFYQPSTEETWEAYQALVTLVQAQQRANLPQVVLYGVADEVLSVLKSTICQSPLAKKAEIERILEPIPDHLFFQLVSIAELITDYYVRSPVSKTDERVTLFVPEKDFYQPKSEVTSTAYKLLLDLVKGQLQFPQPPTVECVIAHEVLAILKEQDVLNSKKKERIEESFLGEMPDESFENFLFAADLISDFHDFTYSGIPAIGDDDMARNVYIGSQSSPKRSRRTLPGFDFGCGGGGGGGSNSDQMDLEEEAPMDGYDEDAKLVYSSEEEESYLSDEEDIDGCGSGPENRVTAGVRDLSLSSPVLGAKDVYSSETSLKSPKLEHSSDEETHITTGVRELSLNSPKPEYSSEEELIYLELGKPDGSDKEDSDGWVQID